MDADEKKTFDDKARRESSHDSLVRKTQFVRFVLFQFSNFCDEFPISVVPSVIPRCVHDLVVLEIEAKETIEMSLRLLGGMRTNGHTRNGRRQGEKKKAR